MTGLAALEYGEWRRRVGPLELSDATGWKGRCENHKM
jgi:hypothetical protein